MLLARSSSYTYKGSLKRSDKKASRAGSIERLGYTRQVPSNLNQLMRVGASATRLDFLDFFGRVLLLLLSDVSGR